MKQLLLTAIVVLCCFGITQAGITLYEVDGLTTDGKIKPNTPITFHLRLTNYAGGNIKGFSHGFRIYSPDGATWTPIAADTTNQGWPSMFDMVFQIDHQNTTGSGADTIGYGGASYYQSGIPDGFDEISFLIHTSVDASQAGKTLCLDSCFYGAAGEWVWSVNSSSYYPSWDGPHCFEIAEAGEISLDHVDGLTSSGKIIPNTPITFHLRLRNNTGEHILGLVNNFRIYSPDGAEWTPITGEWTDLNWSEMFSFGYYTIPYSATGSGSDTIQFGGENIYSGGVPDAFDEISFLIHTSVDNSQAGKTLCIDSASTSGSSVWKWKIGEDYGNFDIYSPSWDGPHCFEIAEAPEIVSIYPPPNSIIPLDELDSILVTFNTDVDPLIPSYIDLFPYLGNWTNYSMVHSGGNDKVRFSPIDDPPFGLMTGDILTAVFSESVESPEGLPFTDGYSFSYRIAPTTGSGKFDSLVYNDVGDHPRSIIAFDFNDDELPDLITANKNSDNISILRNDLDSFYVFDSTAGDYPFSLCVVPGGYRKKFCVANRSDNSVYTYRTYPEIEKIYEVMVGDGPISICSADFNNNCSPDLATANYISNDITILAGYYNPQYDTTHAAGDACFAVCTGDFNNDGHFDIAAANNNETYVSIFMNNGDGSFAAQTTVPCDTMGEAIICADFNGDLWLDLAVAHHRDAPGNNLSILLNDGAGNFSVSSTNVADGRPYSLTTADFDADLDLDIAVCSWGANGVVTFFNNGDGTFTYDTLYITGGHADGITAADFNGDGAIDLAVANGGGDNVAIMYNYVDPFVCDCEPGNTNGDGTINIFDITYTIAYLYLDGPAPTPYELCNGDPNGDCVCNIFDITYIITYLYIDGPPPRTCEEWLSACGSPLRK